MYIIDYLIVVALDEEYQSALPTLSECLRAPLVPEAEGALVVGRTTIPLRVRGKLHEELLVAICPGRMGHAAIAATLPYVLDRYRPRDIILIGLSGSFDSKELLLGDVLVPMKVFNFAEAKVTVVQDKDQWTFRTIGDRVTSHARADVRSISDNETLRKEWEESCRAAARADPRIAGRIGKSSHDVPKIHVHHNDSLASGNVVVSSQQFADQLQHRVDSTLRGVEMEAGGLFEALDTVDWQGRVLILRGISDYANKQKSRLEKQFGTAWRQYAMQNAVRLAVKLIQQRPRWQRDRTGVSPAYVLSLTPHSESYRYCADVQINSTAAGAQNLAFLPLLDRRGGTPKLWVTIQNEASTLPDMLLRERADPYVETRYYIRSDGRLEMSKEGTDRPFSFDLFVSSAHSPVAFKMTIADEFGRTEERQFPGQ